MAAGVSAIGRRDLQSVIVVDVAGAARNANMLILQRETGGAVIEGGSVPAGWSVAIGAICRGKRGAGS